MSQNYWNGFLRGTGADLNVPIGWIPDYVKVVNMTDGDKIFENELFWVVAFTSGGTDEIKAGDKLHGNTGDATAIIHQVIIDSGTWAAGDAAGWFVLSHDTLAGDFESETAYRENVDSDGDDKVTLSAAQDNDGIDIDTEVTATTTDDTTITPYVGSQATNAKGFKIGATVSEDGKLLFVQAWRNSDGHSPFDQTAAP